MFPIAGTGIKTGLMSQCIEGKSAVKWHSYQGCLQVLLLISDIRICTDSNKHYGKGWGKTADLESISLDTLVNVGLHVRNSMQFWLNTFRTNTESSSCFNSLKILPKGHFLFAKRQSFLQPVWGGGQNLKTLMFEGSIFSFVCKLFLSDTVFLRVIYWLWH